MNKLAKCFSLLLPLAMLVSCGNGGGNSADASVAESTHKTDVKSDSLYVRKVENLPDDFIFGMDSSAVPSLERSGVKYYDFDGTEKDVFEIMSNNGINYIRVRVWNDPFDSEGHGYGGGNCDINVAKEIGLRATKYGMKLLVDFHYSDFWADPAKYMVPKAWKGMEIEEKADACYNYTKESLQLLKDAKIDVGMVQIGNEMNAGLAGETIWMKRYQMLAKASQAVREVYPEALVAVHFANPEKAGKYMEYAEKLAYYNLDYDVFGSSYYPYWHGTLDNLATVLSNVANTYGKKTMVLETSYANTSEDTDFYGNTIGESATGEYPFTLAGQTNHLVNLTDTIVNKTKNGIGICYWEGTWITVGNNSWEENVVKWRDYGSGWASEYSAEYDSNDAGYTGGSAVDNQCFFDKHGKALESLKCFALMKEGNIVPTSPDGVENPELTMYTYDDAFTLPEQVNLIYTDNSKKAADVTWESFDLEQARKDGNADYVIKGVADGFNVNLTLHVLEYNYVQNYSFEDGLDPWEVTIRNADKLSAATYKNEITKENPKSGSYAYHFWASAADTAGFDMEQTVEITQAGTYKYAFSVMGGIASGTPDESKQDIYGYIKVDGEIVKTVDAKFHGYSKTYENGTYQINDIALEPGHEVKVGIHLFANEAGSWGDVDDVMLNIVL